MVAFAIIVAEATLAIAISRDSTNEPGGDRPPFEPAPADGSDMVFIFSFALAAIPDSAFMRCRSLSSSLRPMPSISSYLSFFAAFDVLGASLSLSSVEACKRTTGCGGCFRFCSLEWDRDWLTFGLMDLSFRPVERERSRRFGDSLPRERSRDLDDPRRAPERERSRRFAGALSLAEELELIAAMALSRANCSKTSL